MNTLAATAAATSLSAAFDLFGAPFYEAVARADSSAASQIFAGVAPLDAEAIGVIAPLGVALKRASSQFGGPLVTDLSEAREALLAGRSQKVEAKHGEILRDLDATTPKAMLAAAQILSRSNSSAFQSLFYRQFPEELMIKIRGKVASVQELAAPLPTPPRNLWQDFRKSLSAGSEEGLRQSIRALILDPDTTDRELTKLFLHYSFLVRRLTFEVFCELREMEQAALAKHFEFQKAALEEGLQSPSIETQSQAVDLLHFFVQRGLEEKTLPQILRKR